MCFRVVPLSAISSTKSTRLPRRRMFGSAVTLSFPCRRSLYERAETMATFFVSNAFATSATGNRPLTVMPTRYCGLKPLARTFFASFFESCSTCRHERITVFIPAVCGDYNACCDFLPFPSNRSVIGFGQRLLGTRLCTRRFFYYLRAKISAYGGTYRTEEKYHYDSHRGT